MANLYPADIPDLVQSTLSRFEYDRARYVLQSLRETAAAEYFFNMEKLTLEDGIDYALNIAIKDHPVARRVGLFTSDNVSIGDHLERLTVPWRYYETHWGWEEYELKHNRGRAMITKLLEPRFSNALIDKWEMIEDDLWSAPSSPTADGMWGVPVWVVYAGATTKGFTGGAPTGWTNAIGGISTTTYPRWKNYAASYTSVTAGDLMDEVREGLLETRWKSPKRVPQFRGEDQRRCRGYAGTSVYLQLQRLAEAQNESIGFDLAAYSRDPMVQGHPIHCVHKLDDDTNNPLYMIDHDTLYPICLTGSFFSETGPIRLAGTQSGNHRTHVIWNDSAINVACIDRRRNSVYSTSIA